MRRKDKKLLVVCLLSYIIATMLFTTAVYAKSSKVVMNIWEFDFKKAPRQAAKIASKIGGMKKKGSSRYDSAYYAGKRVTIGVSIDAEYGKKNDEFLRITNSGNKRFTIKGIMIGDSRASVIKKMKSLKGIPNWLSPFQDYNNGTLFWSGNSSCIKAYYSMNNKLKKWVYIIAPSG